MSYPLDKIILITRGFRTKKLYREEAPVNNVGGGQIAGTSQAGDDPPVDLRKKNDKFVKMLQGADWLTETEKQRVWLRVTKLIKRNKKENIPWWSIMTI